MKKIVLLLVCMLLLSGCIKDRLTHLIEGTYTVSGLQIVSGMMPDSTGASHYSNDSTYITNATIEISKRDKEEVKGVFNLPDAETFTLRLDNSGSNEVVYLFGGGRSGVGFIHTAQFYVFANDLDSVYVRCFFQNDSTHIVTNYFLNGRKN